MLSLRSQACMSKLAQFFEHACIIEYRSIYVSINSVAVLCTEMISRNEKHVGPLGYLLGLYRARPIYWYTH